ncbi:MAG: PAS domain S-box protein, partial [Bacteroidota bacterium]
MPSIKLQDLLDLSYLNNLLKLFSSATGVPAAILSTDACVIASSGWRKICKDFHRNNVVTANRCNRLDAPEWSDPEKRCQFKKCMNGLWEICIPIEVDGQAVANFFFGQFFLLESKPDLAEFKEQAELFGFDTAKYLAACDRVPVYPRAIIDEMIEENLTLVKLISQMANSALERTRLERSLKQSEERYKVASELSSNGIWEWDLENGEMSYSHGFYRLLGYRPGEIDQTARAWKQLIHTADKPQVQKYLEVFLRSGSSHAEFSYRVRTHGGQWKWLTSRARVTERNSDGWPIRLTGVHIDISDTRQREERMLKTSGWLAQIINSFSIPAFVIDSDHMITHWNSAIETLTATSAKEMIGSHRPWYPFYKKSKPTMADLIIDGVSPEKMTEHYSGKMRESEAVPGTYEVEDFFPTLGKSGRWLLFTSSAITNEDGKITGAIETIQDITGRRKAEIALAESEMKFRSMTDQIPVGIYRTTEDGRILHANPALARIVGYENVDDILDRNAAEFYVDKNDRLAELEMWQSSTGVIQTELRLRHRNGSIIWVRDYGRAIYDDNGIITYFDGVIENITEQKNAREKIRSLNRDLEKRVLQRTSELEETMSDLREEIEVRRHTEKELTMAKEELFNALEKEKELNKLKSRFISMISHEYRTPLTVIMTSTYIIERIYDGSRKSNFEDYLSKIRRSVRAMTILLENVLTIGKNDDNADFQPSTMD